MFRANWALASFSGTPVWDTDGPQTVTINKYRYPYYVLGFYFNSFFWGYMWNTPLGNLGVPVNVNTLSVLNIEYRFVFFISFILDNQKVFSIGPRSCNANSTKTKIKNQIHTCTMSPSVCFALNTVTDALLFTHLLYVFLAKQQRLFNQNKAAQNQHFYRTAKFMFQASLVYVVAHW